MANHQAGFQESVVEERRSIDAIFKKLKIRSARIKKEPVENRIKLLRSLETFLLRNKERITQAIYKDFRKPLAEAEFSELYQVVSEIRHSVSHLHEWAASKKVDAPLIFIGTTSEIRYEPKGVCLIISPWNYPFNLCFAPLISCLAAGNTAILKPSELTPHSSGMIVELVKEFFDDEVVTVVEGGPEVSAELLKLPFDHIFFTGSPAVGKIVMKAAAENLTSVTLELGGKSPVIIDSTANIKDAARRVCFGKFLNNGQTCIAPDYVIVHESVKAEFITELKFKVAEMFGENGAVDENSGSYARIVNDKNFLRLLSLIDDAAANGAVFEMNGSHNAATRFLHPVILSSVPAESRAMNEEIFGPVLPIISFSSAAEVIDIINGKPKPLALYVFSKDKKFREEILSATSAGGVCINDCLLQFIHPNLPAGGVNHSGVGKAHGYYGFLAFSNEKPVVRQKSGFAASYSIQPPYTKRVKKLIEFIVKWV